MREFELEPGEHVVKEVRKHWFLFLMQLLPFGILFVLPLALPNLLTLASNYASIPFTLDFDDPITRAVLGAWLLLIWSMAWSTYTRYYLNLWVLTNQRIVEIEQKRFWSREVSSLLLDRVQDVTVDAEGVIISLLDIGDLYVQSAGAVERFDMKNIPHPAMLRDILLKYVSTDTKTTTGL